MTSALPPLAYAHDALAPTTDELTMRMHHDKHHRAWNRVSERYQSATGGRDGGS
jgi:Fe-Mn family superoxide dismutase